MEKKICGRCSFGRQYSQTECTCHLQVPYGASPDILWPLVFAGDFCPAWDERKADTIMPESMIYKEDL